MNKTPNSKRETPALTARQREVLKALASGRPRKQVAEELGITSNTFENHRKNIYLRLGIHSVVEAVRYAARLSLL